jgi:hypothetical protein
VGKEWEKWEKERKLRAKKSDNNSEIKGMVHIILIIIEIGNNLLFLFLLTMSAFCA